MQWYDTGNTEPSSYHTSIRWRFLSPVCTEPGDRRGLLMLARDADAQELRLSLSHSLTLSLSLHFPFSILHILPWLRCMPTEHGSAPHAPRAMGAKSVLSSLNLITRRQPTPDFHVKALQHHQSPMTNCPLRLRSRKYRSSRARRRP
jgi:hypothetical protein